MKVETGYYAQKLNSGKLYEVYRTRIPRVIRYLQAEIDFVRGHLRGEEKVLELGAGYGRIMKELAPFLLRITGIDIAEQSVAFGKEYLKEIPNCTIEVMDAHSPKFDETFDVVLCLQNGLSAIKGDPENLIRRSVRLLAEGGKAFFSSYSPKFWEHCLAWFREQADRGLLGEIDMEKTGNGRIVCKDGFTATTFDLRDMERLGELSGCRYRVEEVEESSIFLILFKDPE
jgi:2-polyprenyl-6-hydroxyphenyl methylase/3-demethylubiquinone-9 3-methyltransferase